MNRVNIASLMLGLLTAGAWAAEPATRPAPAMPPPTMDEPPPPWPEDGLHQHRPDAPGLKRGFDHPRNGMDRPNELGGGEQPKWDDVAAFLQANSPNRWQGFQKMPEGLAKEGLKHLMTQRYRFLMGAKEQGDQKLYEVGVQRIRLEDDIWGIASKLKEASGDQKDSLRSQLRDKVAAAVDNSFEERTLRLEKLEESLQEEKNHLDEDRNNRDAMIASQVDRWEKGGPLRGGPGGGEGPRHRMGGSPGDGAPPPGDGGPPPDDRPQLDKQKVGLAD